MVATDYCELVRRNENGDLVTGPPDLLMTAHGFASATLFGIAAAMSLVFENIPG